MKTEVSHHLVLGQPFDITALNFDEIDFASLLQTRGSSERWTGYYVPKSAGTFDIFVQQGGFSPSGFRMYVDGKLLFDNWSNQKFILAQTSVTLDAKPHKIVVEHHTDAGFGLPFIRMGIVPQGSWVDPMAEELASKPTPSSSPSDSIRRARPKVGTAPSNFPSGKTNSSRKSRPRTRTSSSSSPPAAAWT